MSETLSKESVKSMLEAVRTAGELLDMKGFEKCLKETAKKLEASTVQERTLNLEKK